MSGASDFLLQMAAGSRDRVATARRACSAQAMLERALAAPPPPPLTGSQGGFDLIAELKWRSPAVGPLRSAGEDVAGRVIAYAKAGAAAVSILTEPSRFDGSMAHLQTAVESLAPLHVPAMRKDFLVDPYQISEARAAGAGGVLLILRLLSRDQLTEMLEVARRLSLFVLLEAFDEVDIERLHELLGRLPQARPGTDVAPLLAGLNCRDLTTLQIVPARLGTLAELLPKQIPRVAESGVLSVGDARRVAEAGYDYALVGSALMQDADPHSMVSSMLSAGRAAASGQSGSSS